MASWNSVSLKNEENDQSIVDMWLHFRYLDTQLGTSPVSSVSIVLNLVVSLHSEPWWDGSAVEVSRMLAILVKTSSSSSLAAAAANLFCLWALANLTFVRKDF